MFDIPCMTCRKRVGFYEGPIDNIPEGMLCGKPEQKGTCAEKYYTALRLAERRRLDDKDAELKVKVLQILKDEKTRR